MKPQCKAWYHSKTIWFNILTFGGAALDGLMGISHLMEPVLSPEVYPLVMLVIGGVNVALRAITSAPIGWKEDVESKG